MLPLFVTTLRSTASSLALTDTHSYTNRSPALQKKKNVNGRFLFGLFQAKWTNKLKKIKHKWQGFGIKTLFVHRLHSQESEFCSACQNVVINYRLIWYAFWYVFIFLNLFYDVFHMFLGFYRNYFLQLFLLGKNNGKKELSFSRSISLGRCLFCFVVYLCICVRVFFFVFLSIVYWCLI